MVPYVCDDSRRTLLLMKRTGEIIVNTEQGRGGALWVVLMVMLVGGLAGSRSTLRPTPLSSSGSLAMALASAWTVLV